MKCVDVLRPKHAAGYARLIACHQRLHSMLFEQRKELPRSGHPANVRRLDGKVTISNQHAVTVENDSE
jgi:hypothetical protein